MTNLTQIGSRSAWLFPLLLAAACGGGDDGNSADGGSSSLPTVVSNDPINGASGVARNASVSVMFSEEMNPATLTASTFTITAGTPPVAVAGTVIYASSEAVFWPSALLAAGQPMTATISTGAMSAAGNALEESYSWTFTSGDSVSGTLPVKLRTSGHFAILAKSGVSTVPTSTITGDVGVSPAAATFLTGFSMTADSTNAFSTSPQVTGKLYAADYAPPTPTEMTTSIGDMEIAYTDASARAPSVTELGAGNIGGMTVAPGVYKWGTGLLIPTNVTLSGSATDVWIFQIAQDLTMSSGARVILTGGALAKNVFWQVAGSVDFGTTAHCEGIVLTQTAITLRTGATINGRLLAQTAVDIDSSTVVRPAQ